MVLLTFKLHLCSSALKIGVQDNDLQRVVVAISKGLISTDLLILGIHTSYLSLGSTAEYRGRISECDWTGQAATSDR